MLVRVSALNRGLLFPGIHAYPNISAETALVDC